MPRKDSRASCRRRERHARPRASLAAESGPCPRRPCSPRMSEARVPATPCVARKGHRISGTQAGAGAEARVGASRGGRGGAGPETAREAPAKPGESRGKAQAKRRVSRWPHGQDQPPDPGGRACGRASASPRPGPPPHAGGRGLHEGGHRGARRRRSVPHHEDRVPGHRPDARDLRARRGGPWRQPRDEGVPGHRAERAGSPPGPHRPSACSRHSTRAGVRRPRRPSAGQSAAGSMSPFTTQRPRWWWPRRSSRSSAGSSSCSAGARRRPRPCRPRRRGPRGRRRADRRSPGS